MKLSTHFTTLSILTALSSTLIKAEESPTLIPFQGQLTNQAGELYTSGQYTITFSLYDQAIGGTAEWTERHEKVSVINGSINAFLGSISEISGVDFSQTQHLGITIDADDNPATPDPEMVPRTMIISAFHAKKAQSLNGHSWDSILVSGDNPATGQIKGSKIENDGITSLQLANSAVETAKIQNGAITATKLAANVISGNSIVDSSITGADIQDQSLTGADIAAASLAPNLINHDLAFFWAEFPGGAGGGDSLADGVQTRVLNKETILGASISKTNNQFTLQPGTYRVFGSVPAASVNRQQAYLFNVSDDSRSLIGTTEYAGVNGGGTSNRSCIQGLIVVSGTPKTFEIRQYTQIFQNDSALGANLSGPSTPDTSVHTQLYIERLK